MKFKEIERQIALKFEEIEKLTKEKSEKGNILREQINKKLKMLMDAGYGKDQSYKMLCGKIVDFRTLRRWHEGDTLNPTTFDKLITLIEE